MIKSRRLFLVPSISAFILLIPFLGIPLYIMICLWWYGRNQESIHLYFKGINYNQEEIDDKELEKLK